MHIKWWNASLAERDNCHTVIYQVWWVNALRPLSNQISPWAALGPLSYQKDQSFVGYCPFPWQHLSVGTTSPSPPALGKSELYRRHPRAGSFSAPWEDNAFGTAGSLRIQLYHLTDYFRLSWIPTGKISAKWVISFMVPYKSAVIDRT